MNPNEIEHLRQLLETALACLGGPQRTDTPRSPVIPSREPLAARPWERLAINPSAPPPSPMGQWSPAPASGDVRDAQIRALAMLVREAAPLVSRAEDWDMARDWLERAEALGCRR